MKSSLQINAESESQTLKIGNPQNESVTIKSALALVCFRLHFVAATSLKIAAFQILDVSICM